MHPPAAGVVVIALKPEVKHQVGIESPGSPAAAAVWHAMDGFARKAKPVIGVGVVATVCGAAGHACMPIRVVVVTGVTYRLPIAHTGRIAVDRGPYLAGARDMRDVAIVAGHNKINVGYSFFVIIWLSAEKLISFALRYHRPAIIFVCGDTIITIPVFSLAADVPVRAYAAAIWRIGRSGAVHVAPADVPVYAAGTHILTVTIKAKRRIIRQLRPG